MLLLLRGLPNFAASPFNGIAPEGFSDGTPFREHNDPIISVERKKGLSVYFCFFSFASRTYR